MSAPVWQDIERVAAELAAMAGETIVDAVGRQIEVNYKGEPGSLRDPVSEVDRQVELAIRQRVRASFPDHLVLGEEFAGTIDDSHDVVWTIDPVDGTANFINGFPLFCASIGVVWRGRPVVGALWCSASHRLRSGVYHATTNAWLPPHEGAGVANRLSFDGEAVRRNANPDVRRKLAGAPVAVHSSGAPWELRKTGSAAIECAFTASGLLAVTCFDRPNVWDVAGGLALTAAAGCTTLTRRTQQDGWEPFLGFFGPSDAAGTRLDSGWRDSLLIGPAEAMQEAARWYA